MANIVPPLLSDTPPPPPDLDDQDEDEFGDFRYEAEDSLSPPGTPLQLPTEAPFDGEHPVIQPQILFDFNLGKSKDFCDKRKEFDSFNIETSTASNIQEANEVGCSTASDLSETVKITNGTASNRDDFGEFATSTVASTASNLNEIATNTNEIDRITSDTASNQAETVTNLNFDDFGVFATSIGCNFDTLKLKASTASNIKESSEIGCSTVTNMNEIDRITSDTASSQDDTVTDDFGDFTTSTVVNTASNLSEINKIGCSTVTNTNEIDKITVTNLNFDDFGNFATSIDFSLDTLNPEISTVASTASNLNEIGCSTATNTNEIDRITSDTASSQDDTVTDDFGDFATSISCSTKDDTVTSDNFDDFGDFATPIPSNGNLLLLNDKEALAKATEIIREMFPEIQNSLADFHDKESKAGDKIFDRIKSITETHALSFQWPKSASQKLLLKSLNIDLRNILYGPGWNPSMPRFASNLSFTPLEPIKTEISTSNSAEPLPNSKPKPKTVVLRETHISNDISWLEPTIVTPELSRKERPYIEEEFEDFVAEEPPTTKPPEDDFGDFTYSLPQPLKPLPAAKPELSVAWPDPGITDDEIGRFEALGLARQKPPVEEEWTDFVSSQKSPLHRCSTPDLPLSVLNLGAVQPAKQPVPVITPNGLVQTKLATNRAKIRPPTRQLSKPQTRLNIISNQYADQALGQFDQYASSKPEEDEWSDFVSASNPMPDLAFPRK